MAWYAWFIWMADSFPLKTKDQAGELRPPLNFGKGALDRTSVNTLMVEVSFSLRNGRIIPTSGAKC